MPQRLSSQVVDDPATIADARIRNPAIRFRQLRDDPVDVVAQLGIPWLGFPVGHRNPTTRCEVRRNPISLFTPMTDLPPLPEAKAGRYRHYKGGEYEVLGVARHSETLEPVVVYRPLYNDSGFWVRPYAMFFEQIEYEGRRTPRFALMAEDAGCKSDAMSDSMDDGAA